MTYLFSNTSSIFQSNGSAITTVNPLPVTLGSANINIIGNITVPTTVNVASSPENPVHTHITEVGTSGNLLANNISYMPIGGNVVVTSGNIIVTQGTTPWTVTGNVNVTAITSNVNVNPITGSVNATVVLSGNAVSNTNPFPVTGNISVTGGNVNVIPDATSGDFYGEPYAVSITPVVQTYGVYGVSSRDHQTYTSGNGSVVSANSTFNISCTSTAGSYALLRSRRFNTHKPGQTLVARFYSSFDTPKAQTSQRIGVQNQQDAYYIGYNGTQFGVVHTHGGKVPLYRLTVNSYTGSQTVTVTLNGTPFTASLVAGESTGVAAERIARAIDAATDVWLTESVDSYVTFLYTGTLAPLGGTFSVSSSGTFSGAITTVQAGVAATNDWYYDGTDFNLPAGFDNTGYNQWQIKYSWPGAKFYVLDQTTTRYVQFYNHYHLGGSAGDAPQVSNPAYKIAGLAYNLGGSNTVSLKIGDMMSGLEGITNRNNFPGGAAVIQSSLAANDLHHILSIANPLVFNNTINTREVLLQDLTVTTQCNDPSTVYIFLDAPLSTGVQDFQSQDGFSVSVSKVAGLIDVNTNFPVLSFIVGLTGSTTQFALESYRIVIPPGSTMNIAISSTATLQKAAAAISWYND